MSGREYQRFIGIYDPHLSDACVAAKCLQRWPRASLRELCIPKPNCRSQICGHRFSQALRVHHRIRLRRQQGMPKFLRRPSSQTRLAHSMASLRVSPPRLREGTCLLTPRGTGTPKAHGSPHISKPIFANRSGPARLSELGRSKTLMSARPAERTVDSKFFARSKTLPTIEKADFRAVELFHTDELAEPARATAVDESDDAHHALTSPRRADALVIDCDELSSPEKSRSDALSRLASPGASGGRDDGFDSEISTPGADRKAAVAEEMVSPTRGRAADVACVAMSSSPTAPAYARVGPLQRSNAVRPLSYPRTPDDEPTFSQVHISQSSSGGVDHGDDVVVEEDSPRKRMRLVQESDDREERLEQEQTTRKVREGLRQKYAFKMEVRARQRAVFQQ